MGQEIYLARFLRKLPNAAGQLRPAVRHRGSGLVAAVVDHRALFPEGLRDAAPVILPIEDPVDQQDWVFGAAGLLHPSALSSSGSAWERESVPPGG